MKKSIPLLILLAILAAIIIKRDDIYTLYNNYMLNKSIEALQPPVTNEYYRNNKFNYVQTTQDFVPKNRKELMNVIYSIISSGQTNYSFYCPLEYKECIDDLTAIAKDTATLSDINNFVHPYNTFKHIEVISDDTRKVTINYSKNYSEDQINAVNKKIDYLFNKLYNPKDTQINNIKKYHDYVAQHSQYDVNRSDNEIVKYASDIAYGPLIEGYALCGGYSDAISLYLEKMNIPNFKVSSAEHVWNAVLINNKWYHLDLTWDDPITDTGENYLMHDYFLITTKQLKYKAKDQHAFNETIYSELQ